MEHGGWIAQLQGHKFDLAHWERSLKPPFDPWCERLPHNEGFIWGLRSQSFDGLQTAEEVGARAIAVIARLNGALSMQDDAESLSLQAVGRIDAGGQIHLIASAEGRARGRSMVTAAAEVLNAQGKPVPPPPQEPSLAQKWMEVAEGNDDVADMLVFAGRSDWFDIYKAIEFAEKLAAGEHALLGLLGDAAMEFKRIKATANFYRLAGGRTYNPPHKTTPAEAKRLLAVVVRTVLSAKIT